MIFLCFYHSFLAKVTSYSILALDKEVGGALILIIRNTYM